jgi:hypothetical protein
MIGTKRERSVKVCCMCGKEKPIVKHLNGDPNKPVCAACNMKLRRGLASSDQVRAIRLGATVIGALEQLLGLDLDNAEEEEIQAIQARFKSMASGWLGVTAADTAGDPSTAKRSTDLGAEERERSSSPKWLELTQAERDQKRMDGQRASLEKRRAEREAKRQSQSVTATSTAGGSGGDAPTTNE